MFQRFVCSGLCTLFFCVFPFDCLRINFLPPPTIPYKGRCVWFFFPLYSPPILLSIASMFDMNLSLYFFPSFVWPLLSAAPFLRFLPIFVQHVMWKGLSLCSLGLAFPGPIFFFFCFFFFFLFFFFQSKAGHFSFLFQKPTLVTCTPWSSSGCFFVFFLFPRFSLL